MSTEKIRIKLLDIFNNVFDYEGTELKDEMMSDDIEEWDSLTHLQMIMEVEQEFGIKFTAQQIKDMRNVGNLIMLIKEKKL